MVVDRVVDWKGLRRSPLIFTIQRVVPALKPNSGACLMGLLGIVVAVVFMGSVDA